MVEKLLIIGFALAGTALLASGASGHFAPVRYFCKSFGGTLAVSLLLYAMAEAGQGDITYLWAVGFFLAYGVGSVITFTVTLCSMGAEKKAPLTTGLRALCAGLGVVLLAGSLIDYRRENIAVALTRRAVTEGTASFWAGKLSCRIERWGALGKLEPSPQKDELVAMIRPDYTPEKFWETLLSLPPSPGRLAVITAFADTRPGGASVFVTLYDQGDEDAQAVMFQASSGLYPGMLLEAVVKTGRADVVRDVLRRGGATPGSYYPHRAAVAIDRPDLIVLLLDAGIPFKGYYSSPLRCAVAHGSVASARLFLEMGNDPNKGCIILDAADNPDMIALLLENGASPRCTEEYDSERDTALHIATKKKNYAVMARLMETCPELAQMKNAVGRTPVDYADKHDEKALAILRGGNHTVTDS